MMAYVALLRAVNVGGNGKLPMPVLVKLCEAAGLDQVRTYIASGNVVFQSGDSEAAVRTAIQEQLESYVGKPISVVVRLAAEMADVVARNPFSEAPGNRVMALFTDAQLPTEPLTGATGLRDEQVRLGKRELFAVLYPNGMGDTRLRLPAEKAGTARNMNTVAKLADMAAALGA